MITLEAAELESQICHSSMRRHRHVLGLPDGLQSTISEKRRRNFVMAQQLEAKLNRGKISKTPIINTRLFRP
jgi:hypothetical protein